MIKRVLVANRGEIACRVIRACKLEGIESVAIYSQADKDSLHVKLADEAICVGAGANSDSYLNLSNVLMAIEISQADAVHPGYGYFSERHKFAEAIEKMGVKFIGPSPAVIDAMGDKANAKSVAIEAGCPVAGGSEGPVPTEAIAIREAERIGFPILLKAVAGGGGRGIRRVDSASELPAAFSLSRAEAQASFGSGDLIVEKFIENPRHIEIQIIGDEHGNVIHLGERECSVQNLRHQKIVEEAPYARITPELRKKMGDAAVRVASAVGYTNAGTIEFLVDKDDNFYFLEMNTRLQVEHPVTEEVTGVDLVRLQLRVAAGEPLPIKQENVVINGHSIEARITAQDPAKDFAPSTGVVTRWQPPGGGNIRTESHVSAGFKISPFYDPLLAKIIAWGENREECLNRLDQALQEFEVEGVQTNLPFLLDLIRDPAYRAGDFDTGFVPKFLRASRESKI